MKICDLCKQPYEPLIQEMFDVNGNRYTYEVMWCLDCTAKFYAKFFSKRKASISVPFDTGMGKGNGKGDGNGSIFRALNILSDIIAGRD